MMLCSEPRFEGLCTKSTQRPFWRPLLGEIFSRQGAKAQRKPFRNADSALRLCAFAGEIFLIAVLFVQSCFEAELTVETTLPTVFQEQIANGMLMEMPVNEGTAPFAPLRENH
jgi:hypothetical protein